MSDFEDRVKRLLNESVDAGLGPRRPAPRVVTGRTRRRERFSPWLLPLAVAASVAVLLGGTVGIVRLVSGGDHRVPPGLSQSPLPLPDPAPSESSAPSASSSSPSSPGSSSRSASSPSTRHGSTSSTAVRPTYRRISLGEASVAVPAGWVARDFHEYLTRGDPLGGQAWCLTPAALQPSTDFGACPVEFTEVAQAGPDSESMDTDTEGGFLTDPGYCSGPSNQTVDAGDRDFGGRSADYRFFHINCPDGDGTWQVEQYVVVTDRAYVLVSQHATAAIEQAMTVITARSVLPAQDRPLRLEDYGVVRSITPDSGGETVALDRVVRANGTNNNPATYDYFIPTSLLDRKVPEVGKALWLFTDGNSVRQLLF